MVFKIRYNLYKLALWYIGKCNKKMGNKAPQIKELDRLTYKNRDKAYLKYGVDCEWQNFSGYDVLDNAIQKLAAYEDNKS